MCLCVFVRVWKSRFVCVCDIYMYVCACVYVSKCVRVHYY